MDIINALDPQYLDNSDPFTLKFLLSGVGQMASPLQGAWLFSNLFYQMMKHGFPISVQPPRHVVATLCQELLRARDITWPHVVRNRSTVLFERELSKIDRPLTTLSQDDVDPYVESQLHPELTEQSHERDSVTMPCVHIAPTHDFINHHDVEVSYNVELDMPSTDDLLRVLEPEIIIEDFPVDPPFWVNDLLSAPLNTTPIEEETPCCTTQDFFTAITAAKDCQTPVEEDQHGEDHPEIGSSRDTQPAEARNTVVTEAGNIRASEAQPLQASEAGNIRASEAGSPEASEAGNIRASEAGNIRTFEAGNIRASEAGNIRASEAGNIRPPEAKNIRAFEAGNIRASEAGNIRASVPSCIRTPVDESIRTFDVRNITMHAAMKPLETAADHPSIDLSPGTVKMAHQNLFSSAHQMTGNLTPQIEAMTTKPDPLQLHDPWKIAKASEHTSLNHATHGQVYNDFGGIHSFANPKRPIAQPAAGPPEKKIKSACDPDDRTVTSTTAEDQIPMQSMTDPTTDSDMPDLLTVWIGHSLQSLTKIRVPTDTTVGQVALAESSIANMPVPVRATTAMGSLLSVYTHVHSNQIIFLEDGSVNHVVQYPGLRHWNRQDTLWQQQGWVADDEMSFYLKMIGQPNLTNTTAPLLMDDNPDDILRFDRWINEVLDTLDSDRSIKAVHTTCLHRQHWFPITVQLIDEDIHITTTLYALPMVKDWANHAMGNTFHFHYKVAQEIFPADCGFQSIAWIMAQELGDSKAYPMSVDEAIKWREQFANHLINCNIHDEPTDSLRFGGTTESPHAELSALLQQHGVHADRAKSLAHQLITIMGTTSIQKTLGSPRPWADLKTKASALQPPIKLVLAEELQAQIAQRLQSGKPMGNRKNKQARKNVQPKWIAPQASQVQIPDGIFQQQDGTPLRQITLHQLQNGQQGIAVLNISDAKPFFALQQPLSAAGIGVLVLEFLDESLPENHQIIRFPASCPETQEPMILSAALIQLGQQSVHRSKPPKPTCVEEVDTKVIRAVLYRDQCTVPWTTMHNKPVKALLAMDHFSHFGKHDLLDVWDRQFLSKQYQKMKPEEADLFSVVLRLQSASLDQLMQSNSKDGLFFEPRTQSGRQPCPDSRVIWLPKRSFHDVLIAKQSTKQATSIARSGDRFGLRTTAEFAAEIHAQHRPEVAYLDGTNTKVFRIAPLPFGSTKESLQKVFATWEWNARPSHTQGLTPDRQGLVWIAHATEQPSFYIFTMEHGDVLISEVQNHKPINPPSQGVPVASTRTLRHLTATAAHPAKSALAAKVNDDPLQANDPWANAYQGQTSRQSTLTAGQLASMENTVEKRVLAAIQDHVMPAKAEDAHMNTESEQRLTQLERQVHTLTDNLNQLSGSMSSFQQQQQTHNTQVSHQVQALKSQADQQEHTMKSLLEQKMEEQMLRIEALLTNKRSKTSAE
eukprot:s893_g21.t1